MGRILTIESDETFDSATRMAALTGGSLDASVADALPAKSALAQTEHAALEKARKSLSEFHDLLDHPCPAYDHGWLYDDETGPLMRQNAV